MLKLNRVVVVLTPLVFAPLAAIITGWVAKHFPGLPVPSAGQVTALEIAGFVGAVGMAAHWLRGRQLWEARLKTADKAVESGVRVVTNLDPKLLPEIQAVVKEEAVKVLQGLEVKVTPQATTPAS